MASDAYISLGSNMGDRELNLLRAVAELGRLAGARVTALSRFYETSPVGAPGQPMFYNAALRLTTEMKPHELLRSLMAIESETFSRRRSDSIEPRRMDLDILLFGETVLNDAELVIPHPRMCERRFVLVPMNDIAPEARHPVKGKTMAELLGALVSEETVVPV